MQAATTWIDRITDESTLWLNAVRSEEQREFVQAASLYLKDASTSLERGVLVWAALSCSCAADCLAEVGLPSYARLLHRESGRIYLARAESVARTSIREMLWALRQSHRSFLSAGDAEAGAEVARRIGTVSRRIDPFSAAAPVSFPEAEAVPPLLGRDDDSLRGSKLVAEVEAFLGGREAERQRMKAGGRPGDRGSAAPRAKAPTTGRRSLADEKSIINQLG